ncbi:unnamed protein product [Echinostoma caproni]|uniref:Cystatin domain-containing protein n=1 Tax=Echinostoma caproni TaxID=27848 RepID=A0A183AJI7_9TREM|nr:unnamed protein product [Echinostoma caproni]
MRLARANSKTDGSNDVIVYYVLAATLRRKGRNKSGKDAPVKVTEDSKGSTEVSLPTISTTSQAHKEGGPPVESLPSTASGTWEGWTKMVSAAKRNVPQRNKCFQALNLPEAPVGTGQERLNQDRLLLTSILEKVFKSEENVAKDIKVKAAFRLGQDTEICKDVVASNEVESIVVSSNSTGCQYRVITDSGKEVKVYVNTTSGTKCVKVTSNGKSETLCPSGPTNQLTSSSPIEVSADSDTTSPNAPTTTPTEAATEPTKATPDSTDPEPSEGQKKPLPETAPPASGQQGEESGSRADKEDQMENEHQDEQPNVGPAALIPALLRKARANSDTDGSNDVIV